MKKVLILLISLISSTILKAEVMNIAKVKHAGPFILSKPFMIESKNVNSESFDAKMLLDSPISFETLKEAAYVELADLNIAPQLKENQYAKGLIEFSLQNQKYTALKLQINGIPQYSVFIDGTKQSDQQLNQPINLEPATHTVVIQYIVSQTNNNPITITAEGKNKGDLQICDNNKKVYTLNDVVLGKRFSGISISPSGKYLITRYNTVLPKGKNAAYNKVIELCSGNILLQTTEHISWMPISDKYYYTSDNIKGRSLIATDPSTGKQEIIAEAIPDGNFQISPSEDYLLYTLTQNGPEEDKDVFQVIEPDDRQPNWRKRTYLAQYSLSTGMMQPLTFGFHNTWAADISPDGRHILAMTSKSRLTERPTTLYTLYLLDTYTCKAHTLIENDGFLSDAKFSPDGKKILISGSAEALGGIGKAVKEDQIPSMFDYQLYVMDLSNKSIKPITKNFNPNVQKFTWNRADGQIYFTAENQDLISLYKADPFEYHIEQIETREELVTNISFASSNPVLAYYGQGASNSDRSYIIDLKKNKTTLIEDLSSEKLKNIELGQCVAWNFINSKGDTINGRYYLPPYFDPAKKYPLVVDYYGGCSPTSRTFESRYPQHAYAALGYVVYVLNPSGATGFGQEFSARHVNSAGNGPAEDIIEGTKQFCKEHSFINEKKIGCIGASYGGFMTQYLQTQTDIFAAAISHAGISDHTSYWGEGYWGYSYSEVSMAKSYPWSHQNLYVNQSPLYNADKINTPILFLHGDADTNVPVGESIQMYTALKLLGKECAMVLVKEQDHHIVDYNKRVKWQNTIWAWFAKWLQDDPTWWDTLYPPKSL